MLTLHELIPLLQIAVGPVILISGVGLLLLSMTNRYARVIDRSRLLARDLRTPGEAERARAQVPILLRRARLLRLAILLAAASVLQAALLIIVLFGLELLGVEAA